MIYLPLLLLLSPATANFFNFFGGQQQQQQPQYQGRVPNSKEHEVQYLNFKCKDYVCPDTGICAEDPKQCPCPYPGSQLRCPTNNGFICILKPAIADVYDDEATNAEVDAHDDNVRDCGWVKRRLME